MYLEKHVCIFASIEPLILDQYFYDEEKKIVFGLSWSQFNIENHKDSNN